MNDTEQLISDALKRQAERAPHPGPTLARLRRPARKRSRSSVFLMVGTAVAAAAVLFTAGVIVGRGPSPDDGAAALMPTTAPSASVPVKYGLGWVPDGFHEVSRSVNGAEVTRVWKPASEGPMVSLTVGGPLEGWLEGDTVQVAGTSGHLRVTGGSEARLAWRAADAFRLVVLGVQDAQGTALRIAESVKADSATVRSALEYRGAATPNVSGASPSEWRSELKTENFTAAVSTHPPDLSGGQPVDVRGKQGTFVPGSKGLVAVLDHGVWVSVSGALTEGQLVEVANDLKIDAKPDYSWIGSAP